MGISQEVFAYWRKYGAPGISNSEVASFKSMADGKQYTCTKKYEADVRARGLEIVGDEKPKKHKPKKSSDAEIVADIKKAAQKLGREL